MLVHIKDWSFVPNKVKYNHKDEAMGKEFRQILHEEEDEQFVRGWFCFWFIGLTKSNQTAKRKASKNTETKKSTKETT